jgi:cyclophilin family peptidyl-prolyl cis-trans isomerase
MKPLFLLFLLFLLGSACTSSKQNTTEAIEIDLQNPVIKQILNFKNKRNTQNILPFLSVDNPSHRYMAAFSLGSVQDTTAIKELSALLKDKYPEIRAMAAYSLGQTESPTAAQYLVESFDLDSVRTVQAAILEAVGKCGTMEHLKYMATTPPYPIQDSLLWEGQAWSIYRFALRGLVHQEGTTKIMNDFIANSLMAPKARFAAAHYLARTQGIDLTGYENVLLNSVEEETDVNTLLPLIMALAKTRTIRARERLLTLFPKQKDYRTKCNILKGLRYFDYDSVKTTAFTALKDTNLHVKVCAAQYLYYNGNDFDAGKYFELGLAAKDWQVGSVLFGAALKNTIYFKTKTKNFYSSKIVGLYKESNNIYEKGALLKALGNYSWNYRVISQSMFSAVDSVKIDPIIRSSATEALCMLRRSKDYARELNMSKLRVTKELNVIFQRVITEGDPAMKAIVAELLTIPELDFKTTYPDYQFLKEAQSKLSLPSEIETYIYLQKAINYFEGDPSKSVSVKSNSYTEIDWQLIRALKEKHQITMQTSKGNITLQLLPEVAPATVTQFVNLVKAGYYNGKAFHRVLPNFVAQGGCSRGDGWSGFNVTVMSEFGANVDYHEEGMVGMASAGKDTESAQFFITHAPTPFLDNNYTIFAKVSKGMSVVHQLEIGDIIKKIEIN